MIFKTAYQVGQIVYLVTDLDQLPRLITGIISYIDGSFQYQIKYAESCSFVFEQELTGERQQINVFE